MPNPIPDGSSGLWDFSLTNVSAAANTTYCFRIANSDGSALDQYDQYPEVTTSSDEYITVTATPLINIGVDPNKMSSGAGTVNVATNAIGGYNLSLSTDLTSAQPNNTSLIHTVNGSYTIAGLGTSFTPTSTTSLTGGSSAWGFRANYSGSPFGASTTTESNVSSSAFGWAHVPNKSSPLVIRTNSTATDNRGAGVDCNPLTNSCSDVTDMYYGVSASATQASGTYQQTVVYTGVAIP
jgi:hypothetical protein